MRVAMTITDIGSGRRRNAERAHRGELSVAIKKTLRDCAASKKNVDIVGSVADSNC